MVNPKFECNNSCFINYNLIENDSTTKSQPYWYGLTNGMIHLSFGDANIYEYSDIAVKKFGISRYLEYEIARFVEDFSSIFAGVNESVPEKIYNLSVRIPNYLRTIENWVEATNVSDEQYLDEVVPAIAWIADRELAAPHMTGGPKLYFVRYGERIRIIWDTHARLDGVALWKANSGFWELYYAEFVEQIECFGHSFFNSMETLIRQYRGENGAAEQIMKASLLDDNKIRRQEFLERLSILKGNASLNRNWDQAFWLSALMTDNNSS